MRHIGIIVVFLATLVAGCMSPRLPDPHNHVVNVHAVPWRIETTDEAANNPLNGTAHRRQLALAQLGKAEWMKNEHTHL